MLKKLIEALFGKKHETARLFDFAGMNDTRARLHKMKARPASRPKPLMVPVPAAATAQTRMPINFKEVPMVNEAFLVAVDADYSITSFHRDNPRAKAQRNFLDQSKDELLPEMAVRRAMPSMQGVRQRDRDSIRKWFAPDKFDQGALEDHLSQVAAPAKERELVRHEAFRQTRTNLPSMGVGESKVIFQGISYEVAKEESIISSQEETGTFFPSFAEALGSEKYVDPGSYVSESNLAGFAQDPPPRASRYEPIAGAMPTADDEVPEWMQRLLNGQDIPEAHLEGSSDWIENADFDAAKVRDDIKAPKDVDLSSAFTAHVEEESPCCNEKVEVKAEPCCAEKVEAPRATASRTAQPNEVRSTKKKKRSKK